MPMTPLSPTPTRDAEGGFSMVVVMAAMFLLLLFSAGTIAAVNGDQPGSRKDVSRKQALAAAEAGIQDYAFHLAQDNGYWANCTSVPTPHAVNQRWNGSGADPRTKRTSPDGTSQYAIELLPATGYSTCQTGTDAAASMIDPATRTLRIRSTGWANGQKRSLIGSFKRSGFLDYLYFTDRETSDPAWYVLTTDGRPTGGSQGSLLTWATTACDKWYREGRQNSSNRWSGRFLDDNNNLGPVSCSQIQFISNDVVAGPLHTNDDLYTCSATFGRAPSDRIESGASWRESCDGADPTFEGTLYQNFKTVDLPPTNAALATVAQPAYRFVGKTTIRMTATGITVKDSTMTTSATMGYPSNGVIYVSNGTCGQTYNPLNPYGAPAGCADVYVSGTYGKSLTIASQKDIVIDDDILSSGDSVLGLIADGFVRVYHPVDRDNNDPSECDNDLSGDQSIRIDAAILSLQHSFTVDNYYCGNTLGTLTVNGAIAQKFRGPVGTSSGGSARTGYVKNYTYNDVLAYRAPPNFLDPVKSAWILSRNSEQAPAR
jgi:hypothetical protein